MKKPRTRPAPSAPSATDFGLASTRRATLPESSDALSAASCPIVLIFFLLSFQVFFSLSARSSSARSALAAVLERASSLLAQSRGHLERAFSNAHDNPRLVTGHARLDGRQGRAFRVDVEGRILIADRVVLDTGTRTRVPKVPGVADVDFLHAGNWLNRADLPEHLLVLGAGYVGLEMGQFYRRMGARVTLVERSNRILPDEDADVSRALQAALESEGIRFILDVRPLAVKKRKSGVRLELATREGRGILDGTDLFLAMGRRPNTDDLGLASVGLSLPRSGFVPVDRRLSTRVKGLWAAGDIRGGPMFTHSSWDDFRVLVSQMEGDGSRTTDRIVPWAMFTDPELGRVGLIEREARRSVKDLRVGRFEMARSGKARERGETDGFVKLLVDGAKDRIVGATVLAADGGELIHIFVDLMNAGARASSLETAIHIHPTLAEGVLEAATPPLLRRITRRRP